ncbi:MAG: hypothetical protein ACO1RX_12710 [Candidatus Sericytochromatia bacterium]
MTEFENDDHWLEADELLNEAIISETPILIVEGVDDVPIYERICKAVGKNVEVYAAENVRGIGGGFRGVIDCLEIIKSVSEGIDAPKYILGIIDRDVRPYRGELFDFETLLSLNLYSIESHFITEKAVSFAISNLTRATENILNPETISLVFTATKDNLTWLYYPTLEALKNACQVEYTADFGYDDKLEEIIGRGLHEKAIQKASELDEFAMEHSISNTWENLLLICKGKWLFNEFAKMLKNELSKLASLCKEEIIIKCQFCRSLNYGNCLYKMLNTYTPSQIKQMISNDINNGNIEYIQDRISCMI